MIKEEKYTQAFGALQQVIVRARFLASKESTVEKAVGLLDAAEQLPLMIADDSDRTEDFSASLRDISERYPYCRNIFVEFSRKTGETASRPIEHLKAA